MSNAGEPWTDERVTRLKTLWEGGSSASQIAAELGGVSRNAVIGKVHRLGLSGRVTRVATASAPRIKNKRPATMSTMRSGASRSMRGNLAIVLRYEAEPLETVNLDEDVVIPMSQRLTLMQLEPSTCHWPMGDPRSPDFRFCGAKIAPGATYCSFHARIAYQSEPRRDSRPNATSSPQRSLGKFR